VLCDGSEENGAALALAFVMFLESERMEKQMSEDLCAFGQAAQGEAGVNARMADIAASYIRSRVAVLAGQDKDKAATAPKGKKAKKNS
jgi:hypothetical protein